MLSLQRLSMLVKLFSCFFELFINFSKDEHFTQKVNSKKIILTSVLKCSILIHNQYMYYGSPATPKTQNKATAQSGGLINNDVFRILELKAYTKRQYPVRHRFIAFRSQLAQSQVITGINQ